MEREMLNFFVFFSYFLLLSFLFLSSLDSKSLKEKGFGSNYITSRVFIFKRLNESLIGSVSMKDDLYFRDCVHGASNKNNQKFPLSYCPR